MKIVIVGGYGVFGERLAELLLRDGHQVFIAGPNPGKAAACAIRLGGRPLVLDREGDLTKLAGTRPRVVVDAAGPFHAYGGDRYRLPRFCIENGMDYLDLSDDAQLTAGISELDAAAKQAGRFVISGASSVPGISSAAVAALARGLEPLSLIETAIVPGNRAPRGRSVIAAIMAQVGGPLRVWRGGAWRQARAWSERRVVELEPGLRRVARTISVPDLVLFPDRFGARSVTFRAGLELWLLNVALSIVATARRLGFSLTSPPTVAFAHWVSRLVEPWGSDRGGMTVDVVGEAAGEHVSRRWRLVAEHGEGPYIPAVAARALIRRIDKIAPGARACLAETTLAEIEDAMADLAVTTAESEAPRPTLFRTALGERWRDLPPTVRRLHGVQDQESFSGTARVERGKGLVARLAALVFQFPEAGEDAPLVITKTRTPAGEIWERRFAGRRFRSHLTPSRRPGRYRERFGLLDYEQELPVRDGALHFVVRRGWLLGLPLPGPLLPRSEAREYEEGGVFRFDVGLYAPLGLGLIVRYRGWVKPDAAELPPATEVRAA